MREDSLHCFNWIRIQRSLELSPESFTDFYLPSMVTKLLGIDIFGNISMNVLFLIVWTVKFWNSFISALRRIVNLAPLSYNNSYLLSKWWPWKNRKKSQWYNVSKIFICGTFSNRQLFATFQQNFPCLMDVFCLVISSLSHSLCFHQQPDDECLRLQDAWNYFPLGLNLLLTNPEWFTIKKCVSHCHATLV